MTPEELEAIQNASAELVTNPTAWIDLTSTQQQIFQYLMPNPSFTNMQRDYLDRWWLPVTDLILDDLNNLCPPNMIITPKIRNVNEKFISCDLLSDALNNGNLTLLFDILKNLPLTYILKEQWDADEFNLSTPILD